MTTVLTQNLRFNCESTQQKNSSVALIRVRHFLLVVQSYLDFLCLHPSSHPSFFCPRSISARHVSLRNWAPKPALQCGSPPANIESGLKFLQLCHILKFLWSLWKHICILLKYIHSTTSFPKLWKSNVIFLDKVLLLARHFYVTKSWFLSHFSLLSSPCRDFGFEKSLTTTING